MPNIPQPILLDVDTGVDDALAILLALNSPELNLVACTTVAGNVTVEQTTRNTLAVLEVAGRADIPVALGAARPLTRRLTTATYFHGANGLGNVATPEPQAKPIATPAAQFLCEMANRYAGELTVVAVGPLTNLAMAVLLDPDFGRKLKRLVIMGGVVRSPGNVTAVAEANIYNDPEAADVVFKSGANITLVGLDVTHKTVVRWSEIGHLQNERSRLTPATALALDMLYFYCQPYGEAGGAHLHDPLAIGVVLNPAFVQTEQMQIEIETQGKLTRGQTVGYTSLGVDQIENKGYYDDAVGIIVEHPTNAQVCLHVDAPAFVQTFRERLGLI